MSWTCVWCLVGFQLVGCGVNKTGPAGRPVIPVQRAISVSSAENEVIAEGVTEVLVSAVVLFVHTGKPLFSCDSCLGNDPEERTKILSLPRCFTWTKLSLF